MAVEAQPRTSFDVGGVIMQRPFRIRRLGHFGVNVDNIDEAMHFYSDLLGFMISDELDFGGRLTAEQKASLGPNPQTKGYFTRFGTGQLMRNADLAMYRAKSAREGGYVIYDPQMHAHLVERLDLASDLRLALRDDQLRVHYQPVVALDSGALIGVEALVRWEHPARGFVSPATFIPLAEESGLIHQLGRWVLEEACAQAMEWERIFPDLPALSVSVNVSGRQLQRADFIAEVSGILDATELPPERLTLEITESVLIDDYSGTHAKLLALKAKGVRVAIDDFGTGYSSLSYLHQYPVDVLKIDRSFIQRLGSGAGQEEFVQTILRLGESLHLTTVAEGIEDHSQMLALRRLGCHYAQGFHLGYPEAADSITALLGEQVAENAQRLVAP